MFFLILVTVLPPQIINNLHLKPSNMANYYQFCFPKMGLNYTHPIDLNINRHIILILIHQLTG